MTDHGKSISPSQKTDAAIKEYIYHALWKDDFLRRLEYDEIERTNIPRWEDDGGQMLDVGNPIDWSNPDMARELANE